MLGPPARTHPRPYPLVLELLESRANKKLTNEYKQDTAQALAALESCNDINPAMIDLQPEIQWFMRPFLLDFIVELHSLFRLQPQTLFRCFNIVDRYCAKRIVFKRHYQLVGCTALWLAAKYEDKKSRVPTLRELAMMCRNAYDDEMFVQMERHILSTLEWSLGKPTLEDCIQLSVEYSNDLSEQQTPFRYNKPQEINATPRSKMQALNSAYIFASASTSASSSTSSTSSSTSSAIIAIARFLCELSLYLRPFLEFETCHIAITAHLLACTMLQIPNSAKAFHHVAKRVREDKNFSNATHIRNEVFEDDGDDAFVDEEEVEEFDEDEENVSPEIHGAFLSGFDDTTIYKVRKISLLFMQALNNITDVLSNKYKPLGVLAVVQNYINKNMTLLENLHGLSEEVNAFSLTEISNTSLACLADTFLLFNLPSEGLALRTQFSNNSNITNNFNGKTPHGNEFIPATPPSTSQSLFSDHNSSASSIITPTTNNYKVNPFYTFSPAPANSAECVPVAVVEASPCYRK